MKSGICVIHTEVNVQHIRMHSEQLVPLDVDQIRLFWPVGVMGRCCLTTRLGILQINWAIISSDTMFGITGCLLVNNVYIIR